MKFKRAALIIALMFALSACSKGSEAPAPESGTAQTAVTETPAPEAYEKVVSVTAGEACEEIKSAGLYSNKIQIKDKLLTFPMTVGEFSEATGLALKDGAEPTLQSFDTDYNYMVSPSGENDFHVCLYYVNTGTEEAAVNDCLVYAADVSFAEGSTSVFFPGGLNSASRDADVIALFGDSMDEGSLDMVYFEDKYDAVGADTFSSTGRKVIIDADDHSFDLYTAYFAHDPEALYTYTVDNDTAKCSYQIPEKFLYSSLQSYNTVEDYMTFKFADDGFDGELTLNLSKAPIEEFSDVKDYQKSLKKTKNMVDTDTLSIDFEEMDAGGMDIWYTAHIFDKTSNLAADVQITFTGHDGYSKKNADTVLKYCADILSNTTISK